MIPLLCIKCHSALERVGPEYRCICGRTYPLDDGIPVLAEDTNYYGEIPRERKSKLLADMDNGSNWRQLVWEYFGTSYPFLHHIIVDETRNDFRYILPVSRDCVVLDLGAGWGTMACHFARECKEVIALDGTLDRCQFIRKRCKQDNIKNVTPICGNILDRPFSRDFFDIIIMNGALEWVGASRNGQSPRERQIEVLKIVRQILKKDGMLYVGIENSHGYKYILGEMDDHTGIHHISYLDRDKANEKSMEELKRPYETYTYDIQGYTDLLNKAGFLELQFYYPIPDYKSVQALLPLSDAGLIQYYHNALNPSDHANSLAERIRSLECRAAKLGHLSDYVASYSILAGRFQSESRQEIIHQYLMSNWQHFYSAKPMRLRSLQLSSTPGKRFEKGRIKQFIFSDDNMEPQLLAVYCRSNKYDDSLSEEYGICRNLQKTELQNFRVPEFIRLEKIGDLTVLIRNVWRGATLSARLAALRYSTEFNCTSLQRHVKKDFRLAAACLQELHHSTPISTSSTAVFVEKVFGNIQRFYGPAFNTTISQIQDSILDLHAEKLDCLVHGDFTPWNILILKDADGGSRTGLIDWELSSRCSFKILDYGRFCYYYLTELEKFNLFDGTREEILHRIFVTTDHWLAPIIYQFIMEGIGDPEISQSQVKALMQFMILNDAYLQAKYSTNPTGPLAEYYLGLLQAFAV
jgi:ubiquinone/menaquinone biosynthesis C-methylase UbiE